MIVYTQEYLELSAGVKLSITLGRRFVIELRQHTTNILSHLDKRASGALSPLRGTQKILSELYHGRSNYTMADRLKGS